MREDLVQKLQDKYENITFPKIECKDGWYGLLDSGFRSINTSLAMCLTCKISVSSIQSKYGALRVFYSLSKESPGREEEQDECEGYVLDTMTSMEEASQYICETCGTTFNILTPDGYALETICKPCHEGSHKGRLH